MNYRRDSLLNSIKRAVPERSKYVKKVVGSINKHVRGKRQCCFHDYYSLIGKESPMQKRNIYETPSYEEILDDCSEQLLLDNSTVDSGIKKTLFTTEHNKSSDIEMYQPKYYDITPKKYMNISQTSNSNKVILQKPLRCSTPENKCGEQLTSAVLEAANLMRNDFYRPGYDLELPSEQNTFARSPTCKHPDDKFVVNLFESRPSQRWKGKPVSVSNLETLRTPVEKNTSVAHNIQACVNRKKEYGNDMFQMLKRERDKECIKMIQTSNILKVIRKGVHKDWLDELLAEKILLQADLKYNFLVNKIRDLGYTEILTPKLHHSGTVTLSNFEFLLEQEESQPNRYSNFYIISLSCGSELFMSDFSSPMDNKVIFNEKFTFTELNSGFNIDLKIFTIKLKTKDTFLCSLLLKKKSCCPSFNTPYDDININQLEESSILKPSFKCCGEIILTKDHIESQHLALSKIPADSKLLPDFDFSFHVDELKLESNLSGFLTLGTPNRHNELLFWERKWCVLIGTNFSVYNYPSEEDFGIPIVSINLEYCLIPLSKDCLRKKTFLLKTGRPSLVDDKNGVTMRKKNNFVVEKYFFTADDKKDFDVWTDKLETILSCLQDWKKLVFLGDYYIR